MKSSRLFFILLCVIVAILLMTLFISGMPNRGFSTISLPQSDVDYSKWELPHGAKTRLGKGKVNDIKFSPDNTQFAVATTIGVWMYDAKTGKEIALFKGDRHNINGIAFSADGKLLTGTSYAGAILRWNVDNRELLGIIPKAKRQAFHSAHFSEDGTILATTDLLRKGGSILKKVHVQSIEENSTDTPTISNIDMDMKEEDINGITISPDGHFLATSYYERKKDDLINVWKTDTGEHLLTLTSHKQRLLSDLAFSHDGKTIASCNRYSIKLWDIDTATHRATFKDISGIKKIVFSPNDKLIAGGGDDGEVTLWSATQNQQGLRGFFGKYYPTSEFKGHKDEITALAFSPDGEMLLSASEDNTIRAWDVTTGSLQFTCTGHLDEISGIGALKQDNIIVSVVPGHGQIQHWNIDNGHQLSVSSVKGFVSSETISSNATTLVLKNFLGKKIRLLDISENRNRAIFTGHGYSKDAYSFIFEFSPDEKILAITSYDDQVGEIQLWDITDPPLPFWERHITKSKSNRPKYRLKGNKEKVAVITFSPNGELLASGGDSEQINLWNVETGRRLFTLTGQSRRTSALAFSPDGKILASSSYGIFYLWDLTNRMLLRKCQTDDGNYVILFSPDGKTLVVSAWDKVQLYDAQTCQLLSTHKGHSSWLQQITDMVFIEGGKTLASTGGDGTIVLWDWEEISRKDP
ncbi:MAG: WD40 repeat domain-containing protein [Candidatus Poribacteria bacterium]|nr:WD40 repeat domain-containing protein [Candidatus Poribacteria bacterium]